MGFPGEGHGFGRFEPGNCSPSGGRGTQVDRWPRPSRRDCQAARRCPGAWCWPWWGACCWACCWAAGEAEGAQPTPADRPNSCRGTLDDTRAGPLPMRPSVGRCTAKRSPLLTLCVTQSFGMLELLGPQLIRTLSQPLCPDIIVLISADSGPISVFFGNSDQMRVLLAGWNTASPIWLMEIQARTPRRSDSRAGKWNNFPTDWCDVFFDPQNP